MDVQILRRGVVLPKLKNPATESRILEGYQALDSKGNIIIGTKKPTDAKHITASLTITRLPYVFSNIESSGRFSAGYSGVFGRCSHAHGSTLDVKESDLSTQNGKLVYRADATPSTTDAYLTLDFFMLW